MAASLRTLLFAPGNDARKAARALAAPVSAACLDLEDAVAPSEKVAARGAVVEAIAGAPADARVAVRVNGAAPAIAAASERLETLLFGPADLARELGLELTADGEELRFARSAVVLAARAAGRAAPVDGPHVDVADDAGCRVNAEWSRRLGFQ